MTTILNLKLFETQRHEDTKKYFVPWCLCGELKTLKMKIQFDSQQPYQLDAINAVVDVFDGQPLAQGQFNLALGFNGNMTF